MKSIKETLKKLTEETDKPITEKAIKEAPVVLLIIEVFKLQTLLEIRDELHYMNRRDK